MSTSNPSPGEPGMELSDFLLRVSHDLRAPLRAIIIQAERLSQTHGDAGQAIAKGAGRIRLLADGLSAYAIALQTGETPFQSVQMDFLLRLVLARLTAEIRERDAVVTHDELPRVWGDSDRLVQVLENLLSNAIRHQGESAPRIHISAGTFEAGWRISVRDNGPGIEPAYVEKIFRPLERLHGQAGAGMGLAICREIVQRHGGRIWVDSEPGHGATFTFTLGAG